MAPRGLRAWHAIKGDKANVGDPKGPPRGVLINEYKNEEIEMTNRKSDGS